MFLDYLLKSVDSLDVDDLSRCIANCSEYAHLKNQIESEWFPSADGSTQQSFHDLSRDLQQNKLKDRLKKYCQKACPCFLMRTNYLQ